MACKCDRGAIIAASVQLFHATMAQMYNGLTVSVSGRNEWWTGSRTSDWDASVGLYKWSGERYEGNGATAVYSYENGTISVLITYNLENKGTWEQVYGTE